MKTVFTIGFNKKSLRRFAEILKFAGVDAVVDVRLNNTSQLAGYSKRDDLQYILELLGIAYEHHPQLAPTQDMLTSYRSDGDFEAYERDFARLIEERDMGSVGQQIMNRYSRPCLLCAEETAQNCHRRIVAEEWARVIPDLYIKHL